MKYPPKVYPPADKKRTNAVEVYNNYPGHFSNTLRGISIHIPSEKPDEQDD